MGSNVVIWLPLIVKVYGFKRDVCVCSSEESGYTLPRGTFAQVNEHIYYVIHCLLRARHVLLKSMLLAPTKQCNATLELFGACANVSVVNV